MKQEVERKTIGPAVDSLWRPSSMSSGHLCSRATIMLLLASALSVLEGIASPPDSRLWRNDADSYSERRRKKSIIYGPRRTPAEPPAAWSVLRDPAVTAATLHRLCATFTNFSARTAFPLHNYVPHVRPHLWHFFCAVRPCHPFIPSCLR